MKAFTHKGFFLYNIKSKKLFGDKKFYKKRMRIWQKRNMSAVSKPVVQNLS